MDKEYKQWLTTLKQRIRFAQIKAALKVNAELIALYWQLGGEILQKSSFANWGDGWLYQLSKDLIHEFPNVKGFSHTNLKYILRWYQFHNAAIGQQVVAQLPDKGQGPQEKANSIVQQPAAQSDEIVSQLVGQIGQQPVDQIPSILTMVSWGIHLQIITRRIK